jgi:hypothetical protein
MMNGNEKKLKNCGIQMGAAMGMGVNEREWE